LPEIRNPNLQNQGPGGDSHSNMVFWLLLLLVFLGYETFYNKPKSTPPQPAPAGKQAQQPAQPAVPSSAATPAQAQTAAKTAKPAHAAAPAPAIVASAPTQITVENELYRIVFTNRGARVRQWVLKKYFDSEGRPLDMVQPQASERFGFPLELFTYQPDLTKQLNTALYQVTVNGAKPPPDGVVIAPATLAFHYAQNGLDVVKTMHFSSSYVVSIDTEVKRDGAPVRALVEWPAGLGDMEEFAPPSLTHDHVRTPSYFVTSINGKQNTVKSAKVSGDATLVAPYGYAAVDDLYFAAAFLPQAPSSATVVTLHHTIDIPANLSDPNGKKTPADVIGLAVGDSSGVTRLRLFAGPKATEVLSSIHAIGPNGKADGPSLQPLIDYGIWTIFAKPLYYGLRFLRNLMGPGRYTWGWAIIIITVLFTVAMMPTRFMMMKSSLKMMRIQPKVEALKKRYAHLKMNDPKKAQMNTEMMALYKEEGVNMYGGCLPMLVQMPLFFAYYKVLENAIELRQAHWLWLPDLSAPDPTYVLPILIIVTMFVTQLITPSPGMDPAQRRMMAFVLPVVIGFTLLHFASGLALYWATSNVINLGLQLGINRSKMGKEMTAIAARKAMKKKAGAAPRVLQGRR
jgi:YidC/Oxa1 family membrane protein insertase